MGNIIKVMLVEDNPDYQKTLSLAAKIESDIELIGQYGTAEEALRKLERMSKKPHMVLLDLKLPGISGAEALPWFKKYSNKTKVIVLTQSNKEADVVAAISAGANGYLLKGATRRTIFDGIRSVMEGGAMIDPKVANYLLEKINFGPSASKNEMSLSKRELEILKLLSVGYAQKEISEKLKISNNTVSTHIRRIYDKLEVHNAPSAISMGYKRGILD